MGSWGGGILRMPYKLTVSNEGALQVSISNEGALKLDIYNPKTDDTLQAGINKVATITGYEGDYGYDLMFTVTDVDDNAFNLTGATVKFKMASHTATTLKIDGTCTLVVAASGTCAYTVVSGDFDTTGDYKAELEITISGKVYTIQGIDVCIIRDLPD